LQASMQAMYLWWGISYPDVGLIRILRKCRVAEQTFSLCRHLQLIVGPGAESSL
jgi:hypothetical protein